MGSFSPNRVLIDERPLSLEPCAREPPRWNAAIQSAERTVSNCTQTSVLPPHATSRLVPSNLTAGCARVAQHPLTASPSQKHRTSSPLSDTSQVSERRPVLGSVPNFSNVTLAARLCMRGCVVVRAHVAGEARLAALVLIIHSKFGEARGYGMESVILRDPSCASASILTPCIAFTALVLWSMR